MISSIVISIFKRWI